MAISFLLYTPFLHFATPKSTKALSLRNHVVLMEVLQAGLDSHSCQGWRSRPRSRPCPHTEATWYFILFGGCENEDRRVHKTRRGEASTRISHSNQIGTVLHVAGSRTKNTEKVSHMAHSPTAELGLPREQAAFPAVSEPNHYKFILGLQAIFW